MSGWLACAQILPIPAAYLGCEWGKPAEPPAVKGGGSRVLRWLPSLLWASPISHLATYSPGALAAALCCCLSSYQAVCEVPYRDVQCFLLPFSVCLITCFPCCFFMHRCCGGTFPHTTPSSGCRSCPICHSRRESRGAA